MSDKAKKKLSLELVESYGLVDGAMTMLFNGLMAEGIRRGEGEKEFADKLQPILGAVKESYINSIADTYARHYDLETIQASLDYNNSAAGQQVRDKKQLVDSELGEMGARLRGEIFGKLGWM